MEINPDRQVTHLFRLRWLMEDMFLQALDAGADYVAAIHPIWRQDLPGWYVWPGGRPGTFEILLEEVVDKEADDETDFISGRFSLRYYPHPDEPEFSDFAFAEQVVRLSDLFAESGVPRDPVERRFHEAYYQVGALEIFLEDNRFIHLAVETQERWVEEMMSELRVPTGEDVSTVVLRPGELGRRVAGEQLCLALLDLLEKGFARAYQARKIRTEVQAAPGIIHYVDGTAGQYSYTWEYPAKRHEISLLLEADSRNPEELARDLSLSGSKKNVRRSD